MNSSSINEREEYHVVCEPVINILSAEVVIDSHTWEIPKRGRISRKSFNVYGSINIQDLKGSNKYNVYEQIRHKSPQSSIYPGMPNFLKLSGPKEIPSLNEPLVLLVDIFDDKSDHALFCGEEHLFKTTTPKPENSLNQFEMIDTLQFQEAKEGSGHLEVRYVAFKFGVYARVRMFLCKDVDDDKKGVEVYGLISAKCNPLMLLKERCDTHMFNVKEDDHQWVRFGDEILLFKDLVAVPAYSELEISVNLRGYDDPGFSVFGTACFKPSNDRRDRNKIPGVNGYYVMVEAQWCKPSLLNEPCDRIDISLMVPMPKLPKIYASVLLEVLSLFISRPDDKEVGLYGCVKVLDSRGSYDIFTCSESEPYFLARGCNLVHLQGPNRAMIPESFFSIYIDLSDINGLVKIKGYVGSSFGIYESQKQSWLDKRLCSVIRCAGANKKSFAAVNYTLFRFAVEARLTVCLVPHIKSAAHVKITFSYGMLSYSTEYDSEFFQRGEIFTAKSLKIGEIFELSKFVVAVPMTSSLRTQVDLSFQSIDLPPIMKILTFYIGESKKVIKGDLVDICIDVEWKGHHVV